MGGRFYNYAHPALGVPSLDGAGPQSLPITAAHIPTAIVYRELNSAIGGTGRATQLPPHNRTADITVSNAFGRNKVSLQACYLKLNKSTCITSENQHKNHAISPIQRPAGSGLRLHK